MTIIGLKAALAATGLAITLALGSTPADAAAITISSHTVDGGGGASAGSGIRLVGVIGQPDAGVASGAGITLAGGFLAGVGPATPRCAGDLDGNGVIDVRDLIALLADWGVCEGCPADVDGNGVVDVADLLRLLAEWGPCA